MADRPARSIVGCYTTRNTGVSETTACNSVKIRGMLEAEADADVRRSSPGAIRRIEPSLALPPPVEGKDECPPAVLRSLWDNLRLVSR